MIPQATPAEIALALILALSASVLWVMAAGHVAGKPPVMRRKRRAW